MDYQEWIQNRAEELALEHYDKEYEYLPSNLQEVVFSIAEREYREMSFNEVAELWE